MAARAEPRAAEARHSSWRWLRHFLKQELKPYPGRSWTVARMTIAATLAMWWIMTFRIPGAALGAYYTLLFSRDSARATVQSALTAVAAVLCSLAFVFIGIVGLVGNPFLHFVWGLLTLFVTFFLISSLSEYRAATAFGFLAVTAISYWDFPANTENRVEATLWTALAILTSAAITVAVEVVSQKLRRTDQFTTSLVERIATVESAFRSWSAGQQPDEEARQRLEQYGMTGTALLRSLLSQRKHQGERIAETGALVALVGRLVDLTASSVELHANIRSDERERYRAAADTLHQLHLAVEHGQPHRLVRLEVNVEDETARSLIGDAERTLARIPQVFSGRQSAAEFTPSLIDRPPKPSLFKPDAFSSSDHLRFALKGTLAAAACWVIYNAIDWHGLSTAIATCMITALSTVGSSRQKQLLRVGGAILGGFVIGMSAQAFILTHIDGIGEFTVLFVAVTVVSSWIATASPRISFAGLQTAFAFYVTHLGTFGPQTSLAVARDNVCGILLGLGAMWLSFDQIWAKDAAREVLDSFVRSLRRVAAFDRKFAQEDRNTASEHMRAERTAISSDFDRIRNEADALIFEFGSDWQRKVALRKQIRMWQPQLRTYFLLEISILQHRLPAPGRQLSDQAEEKVAESRRILTLLADLLDPPQGDQEGARKKLNQLLTEASSEKVTTESGAPALAHSMLQAARELARDVSGT